MHHACVRGCGLCHWRLGVGFVSVIDVDGGDIGDMQGSVGVGTLLKEFHASHGMRGFVTQGVGPEMLRVSHSLSSCSSLYLLALSLALSFHLCGRTKTICLRIFFGLTSSCPTIAVHFQATIHSHSLLCIVLTTIASLPFCNIGEGTQPSNMPLTALTPVHTHNALFTPLASTYRPRTCAF
jgi:hypothetical protein